VLPGGIDSRVHLAQPSGDGTVMTDGFESGTRSVPFGGNITVLAVRLQQRGQALREALTAYHALAFAPVSSWVQLAPVVGVPRSGDRVLMKPDCWSLVCRHHRWWHQLMQLSLL
jgi:dihydropyrimidinase